MLLGLFFDSSTLEETHWTTQTWHLVDILLVWVWFSWFGLDPSGLIMGNLNHISYNQIFDICVLPALWEQFEEEPFLFHHSNTATTQSEVHIQKWFGGEEAGLDCTQFWPEPHLILLGWGEHRLRVGPCPLTSLRLLWLRSKPLQPYLFYALPPYYNIPLLTDCSCWHGLIMSCIDFLSHLSTAPQFFLISH